MPATRTRKARFPATGLLHQRLAARFCQRQAVLLGKTRQASEQVRSHYRGLASRLAHEAYRLGLAGLGRLGQRADQLLADAAAQMEAELLRLGRLGHQSAVEAILQAIPAEWLAILASMAASRQALSQPIATRLQANQKIPEAATAIQPEPEPWSVRYEWQPIANGSVDRQEAMELIRQLLFPAPTIEQVRAWLEQAPPGGLSWHQRLRRWDEPTRAAMLNELCIGLSSGENVDQLRDRLQPLADGLAYKAQRIARTEGNRVAERASRRCFDGMGDLVDGLQIVAVMDEWTRPHHAARHGKIYRRGPDGQYRDQEGQILPDLPDEPNCRCMTIPVLAMPEEFRHNPAARAVFLTATKELIPDPASYEQWWAQASTQERMTAVGVRRYQTVRDQLARLPVPRKPEWADFIDTKGRLIPQEELAKESPEKRAERRRKVDLLLAQRQELFRQVAASGFVMPGQTPVEQAILQAQILPLQQEITQRLRAYREHFRLPPEERRRQRRFSQQVHTPEEIRQELLLRKAFWEAQHRSAPQVPMADLPGQFRRDLQTRLFQIQNTLKDQQSEQFRSALYLPEPYQAKITIEGELPPVVRHHADQAAQFLSRITHKKTLSEAAIPAKLDETLQGGGAFDGDRIRYRPPITKDGFVHEAGHALTQKIPKLDEAARQWLQKVTAGGKIQTETGCLDSMGRPWQYRQRTDGVEPVDMYDKYLTRIYPNRPTAHEVVSVGLQKLYKNPAEVAEKDPTLLTLLLQGLRQ